VLPEIEAGLATPVAGTRWLTEVEFDEPFTGPIPVLEETGPIPVVEAEPLAREEASPGPVGSIWDALDETLGLPILSRAGLWRRDAVERRTRRGGESEALSA
jgi:hypothetical protein